MISILMVVSTRAFSDAAIKWGREIEHGQRFKPVKAADR